MLTASSNSQAEADEPCRLERLRVGRSRPHGPRGAHIHRPGLHRAACSSLWASRPPGIRCVDLTASSLARRDLLRDPSFPQSAAQHQPWWRPSLHQGLLFAAAQHLRQELVPLRIRVSVVSTGPSPSAPMVKSTGLTDRSETRCASLFPPFLLAETSSTDASCGYTASRLYLLRKNVGVRRSGPSPLLQLKMEFQATHQAFETRSKMCWRNSPSVTKTCAVACRPSFDLGEHANCQDTHTRIRIDRDMFVCSLHGN